MTFYVYSTATNSITYVEYENNASNELSIPKKWPNGNPMKVTIQGGHGVSIPKTFVTPKGIVTSVNDDEMEMLLQNPSFKRHLDRGFMTYDKKKLSTEKKAANMEDKDRSAQITPSDYVKSENSTDGNVIYKMKERLAG